jgi:hypothetical protein
MSSGAVEAARTGSVCGTTPQSPKGCSEGAGVPSGTVQWASVNSAHVMFTPPTEGRRAVGRLRAQHSGQASPQSTCSVGTPCLESNRVSVREGPTQSSLAWQSAIEYIGRGGNGENSLSYPAPVVASDCNLSRSCGLCGAAERAAETPTTSSRRSTLIPSPPASE